jgi:hypothetical protein
MGDYERAMLVLVATMAKDDGLPLSDTYPYLYECRGCATY